MTQPAVEAQVLQNLSGSVVVDGLCFGNSTVAPSPGTYCSDSSCFNLADAQTFTYCSTMQMEITTFNVPDAEIVARNAANFKMWAGTYLLTEPPAPTRGPTTAPSSSPSAVPTSSPSASPTITPALPPPAAPPFWPPPSVDASVSPASSGGAALDVAPIGAGAAGGVLLLALLIFWLWRRRRLQMAHAALEDAAKSPLPVVPERGLSTVSALPTITTFRSGGAMPSSLSSWRTGTTGASTRRYARILPRLASHSCRWQH
jgi:hypothetical protein